MKRIQEEAAKAQEMLKKQQESEGDKKIYREIKYQMNLLTAENYDIIKIKILEIAQLPDALDKVINTIIEKAWTEIKYASIYS